MKIDMNLLYEEAKKNAAKAYAPYSKFHVGAALLGEDGVIYPGANVENRSYGLAICAERSAVVGAIARGCQHFLALAIATPDSKDPVGPCGACRQVFSEFMDGAAPVRFGGTSGELVNTTVAELLPYDSLYDLKEK
jgi:cytidine deaminase